MKRCVIFIVDEDSNEYDAEEIKPDCEATLRCDGENWIVFHRLNDSGAKHGTEKDGKE